MENVLLTTPVEPSNTSLKLCNQKHFSPELVHPARLSLPDVCSYLLDILHEPQCNFSSLKISGTSHCLIDLHEECSTMHDTLDITTCILDHVQLGLITRTGIRRFTLLFAY